MRNATSLMVLAAGIGSRYGGIKQLDPMGPTGETILDYSVYDAIRAGFDKVVFVIRQEIEADFKTIFDAKLRPHVELAYVYQELTSHIPKEVDLSGRLKPWGTGHALLCARDQLTTPFAVINADDFYGAGAFELMNSFLSHSQAPTDHALVAYQINKTLSENGTVSRGICTEDSQGFLTSVVERTKIYWKQEKIYFEEGETENELSEDTPVSMNFWGFKPSVFPELETLFAEFVQEHGRSAKTEFYIPLFVNHLLGVRDARFKMFHSPDSWFGITYQEDKQVVRSSIQSLIDAGKYPKRLWA